MAAAARRSAASEQANRTMRRVSALLLAVSLAGAVSPAFAAPPEKDGPTLAVY
jgi:hypothetical protein